ncbi:amidoligase family protein [Collibacillus ludicampi]|nr:amidoligase family protein [Collibacillus ludicampi]
MNTQERRGFLLPSAATCRVCHRPLRSMLSVLQGVGPVCSKKVRQALEQILERVIRGEAEPEDQIAYAMSPEERQRAVEARVRQAYLEQLHQNRRPSREPVTVEVESRTREIRREPTTVEWIDRDHAWVQSQRGGRYQVTEHACTCPDFVYRRSRNPELAQEGCRHMQALRLAREEVRERRRQAMRIARMRTQQATASIVVNQTHEENHPTFAQIDWTVEAERDRVLDIWCRNRAWDGVFISRDDAAWETLKDLARQEWEYRYENVLGGTGNTFGVEIEVQFENSWSRDMALRDLYNEGLTTGTQIRGYHSGDGQGFWKPERDGSLGTYGVEFVSPVLNDDPESWKQIERVTEILRHHGAYVDDHCGGHIHLGIAPLDHRTYSWQRLAQIGVGYEKQLYRVGGANSDQYRSTGRPGQHRGSHYAKPLPRGLSFNGNITAAEARRRISNGSRYTIFNTTNIDRTSGRPAIEFRYPNGILDHRQIQAQIQVANAILHQAAVIRNGSPQSEFTPRFSEENKHARLTDHLTPEAEEKNFREFLDVLANPQDRLAATWLWLRGRS